METATIVETGEGRRESIRVLLGRYAAVGVLSVAVDIGSLAVLHSLLGVRLLLATTIAYALALTVNYSLNHVWAFEAGKLSWHRIGRYAVLVAINFGLTIGIITSFTAIGIYYLIAKFVAVAIGAAINFTGYRLWVFR